MILGVDWLRKHSPLQMDFILMEIRITTPKKTLVTFVDETVPWERPPEIVDTADKVMDQAVCGFFLFTTACSEPIAAAQQVPQELQPVLQKYEKIFSSPTGLPPSRPCDHRIPLVEGTKVVNQRPYRVPHHQKEVLEKIIQDLLKAGLIRPRYQPIFFSSSLSEKEGWFMETMR